MNYLNHPIYKDYAADQDGNIYSLKYDTIRLVTQNKHKRGYLQFHINLGNNNRKTIKSHRFIFECFNKRLIEENKQIDHINHNRIDNRISNLREVNNLTNSLNKRSNKEIDELPIDSVKITKYNSHYFENTYFSPSTNCLYRYSEDYLFEITFKNRRNMIQMIDINGKRAVIFLNKLRKNLGL